jgi:hypothetical protein
MVGEPDAPEQGKAVQSLGRRARAYVWIEKEQAWQVIKRKKIIGKEPYLSRLRNSPGEGKQNTVPTQEGEERIHRDNLREGLREDFPPLSTAGAKCTQKGSQGQACVSLQGGCAK